MDEIKNMGSPEDISTIAGLNDEAEDVPVVRSRRATPKSDVAPNTGVFSVGGVGAHRGKNRSKGGNSADRLSSFQAAVVESIDETQRLRKVRDDIGAKGVLADTVKEVATAASGAYASIKEWANNTQSSSSSSQYHGTTSSLATSVGPPCPANVCGNESVATGSHLARSSQHGGAISKHSIIQDLAWPFALCGLDVSGNLPERNDLAPHLQKMRDAVAKAVNGDISGSTNDIWKFAAPNSSQHDDDDNTQCSLDTLQEENNQIRRLGSWGTVGTAGTAGTADTDSISLDQPNTPKEINIGGSGGALEDDDGNVIDPLLLEKVSKKSREKRKHRKKLVKFDYPPIKSLRQCPRPDPADLPDLFFTEHELDQIEDDRYSTMSTDDIEIVAVASKPGEPGQHRKSRRSRASAVAAAANTSTSFAPDGTPGHNGESGGQTSSAPPGRDQPDNGQRSGYQKVKGRPSTPYRRRATDEEDDAEIPASLSHPKSPENGNSGRLVKGVQIYLRERSTGA